jgi:hypothetical protein
LHTMFVFEVPLNLSPNSRLIAGKCGTTIVIHRAASKKVNGRHTHVTYAYTHESTAHISRRHQQ